MTPSVPTYTIIHEYNGKGVLLIWVAKRCALFRDDRGGVVFYSRVTKRCGLLLSVCTRSV